MLLDLESDFTSACIIWHHIMLATSVSEQINSLKLILVQDSWPFEAEQYALLGTFLVLIFLNLH